MPRDVIVSISALRASYGDRTRSTAQIAAAFGMSTRTLHKIAKQHGWAPRPTRKISAKVSLDALRPLWLAGLSAKNIGQMIGTSTQAVQAYAWRHGLRRPRGWRPTCTIEQYREQNLAERMAEAAKREAQARKERAA